MAGKHAAFDISEVETPATPVPSSWWSRIKSFEPAILRGIVVALVSVAAIWGLDLTEWGDRIVNTWVLVFPLIALLQAWWTRQSVVPADTVVAKVEKSGTVVAGSAISITPQAAPHTIAGEAVWVEAYDPAKAGSPAAM